MTRRVSQFKCVRLEFEFTCDRVTSTGPKWIRKIRRCCRSPPRRGAPRGSRPSWCRLASGNSCESQFGDGSVVSASSLNVSLFHRNLDRQQDLNSDGEDEEEFVPSQKDLQSSSEEEEEAGLDSDEEVLSKKGRRSAARSRTPQSKTKSRFSTRTPRKTPNKKVKDPNVQTRETLLATLF